MILILSPAKTLDFNFEHNNIKSLPEFLKKSSEVMKSLKKHSISGLMELQDISKQLAELNHQRNSVWDANTDNKELKPALFAFKGDVYIGLQAKTLSETDIEFAQQHLRILSGLYGVLKPLDVILPYRLEMGTKLKVGKHLNLYSFWGEIPAKSIKQTALQTNSKVLLNLASNEYFKAVDVKKVGLEIISPEFKEGKNGTYKIISFFAKKARGEMARYIIQNKITNPDDILSFSESGYNYNASLSKKNKPVFTRN